MRLYRRRVVQLPWNIYKASLLFLCSWCWFPQSITTSQPFQQTVKMRYFFALATLITAALAVAIPEPQGKCNPDFNCCTFSESACSERLQACTRTCNVSSILYSTT